MQLDEALDTPDPKDEEGRKIGDSVWGVYALYDYDGEPIYVGQTKESLRVRVKRHLTNQRTDAVAMRVLDVFEVAEMELWPIWELQGVTNRTRPIECYLAAKEQLNHSEYQAYLRSIANSRFGAILNEQIPPKFEDPIDLPESLRFELVSPQTRIERGHPDIRIARRAETIARLAAVAHERGEVSDGLRRVLVIQAVRLAYIAAVRLAFAEGRPEPDPALIDTAGLVGTVMFEPSDPTGENRADENET